VGVGGKTQDGATFAGILKDLKITCNRPGFSGIWGRGTNLIKRQVFTKKKKNHPPEEGAEGRKRNIHRLRYTRGELHYTGTRLYLWFKGNREKERHREGTSPTNHGGRRSCGLEVRRERVEELILSSQPQSPSNVYIHSDKESLFQERKKKPNPRGGESQSLCG